METWCVECGEDHLNRGMLCDACKEEFGITPPEDREEGLTFVA